MARGKISAVRCSIQERRRLARGKSLDNDVRPAPAVNVRAARSCIEQVTAAREQLRAGQFFIFTGRNEESRRSALGGDAHDALTSLAKHDSIGCPGDAEGSLGAAN